MSILITRTIFINNKKTSIKLDDHSWMGLKEISGRESLTINQLCTSISNTKENSLTLTHAIKTFIFLYFRAAATEDGHIKAGHGKKQEIKNHTKSTTEKIWYEDFPRKI